MQALLTAKRYKAALDVYRETNASIASGIESGKIPNASFEDDLQPYGISPFTWQIRTAPPQLQIVLDTSNFHGKGQRSFKVIFKSTSQLSFNNISQLIVLDPSTQYHLEFWVKTDQLKSVGMPLVEVVDGNTGNIIGKSEPLHIDSSDWQPVEIDFKTGANTEAVTLRTNRFACGTDSTECPIFGTVWYDDFSLQRTSGTDASGAGKG